MATLKERLTGYIQDELEECDLQVYDNGRYQSIEEVNYYRGYREALFELALEFGIVLEDAAEKDKISDARSMLHGR